MLPEGAIHATAEARPTPCDPILPPCQRLVPRTAIPAVLLGIRSPPQYVVFCFRAATGLWQRIDAHSRFARVRFARRPTDHDSTWISGSAGPLPDIAEHV